MLLTLWVLIFVSTLFTVTLIVSNILNKITSNYDYNFKENLNWNSFSDYSSSSYINSKYADHTAEKVKLSRKQKSAEEQNSKTREIILNYLIKNNSIIVIFLIAHDKNNEI